MQNKFTVWLMELHGRLNPEVLDDQLPDHFDNWLNQFTADDIVQLGDEFAETLK